MSLTIAVYGLTKQLKKCHQDFYFSDYLDICDWWGILEADSAIVTFYIWYAILSHKILKLFKIVKNFKNVNWRLQKVRVAVRKTPKGERLTTTSQV